jgi:ribosomal protein S18 acetylase RimI-like enzyme
MDVPPPAGSEPVVARSGVEQPPLRLGTADDVSRLAGVLADAFMNDPVFTWLLRGGLRLKPRLRTMFATEMEQYVLPNGGAAWTTSGYDGALVVLPPGAWEMPRSATGKEALRWMRAFGTRLPVAIRVQHAMEARHLHEPHFYVRAIGVRPALQGRGVGSTLMQPTLQRADSAGLATYIEASSERSAALYERLGFLHMGVLQLPDGGPPVWPMRRPPDQDRVRSRQDHSYHPRRCPKMAAASSTSSSVDG